MNATRTNATRWIGMALAATLPLGLAGPAAAARTSARGAQAQAQADAQEQAPQGTRRLVRIGGRQGDENASFDVERWRDELSGADLDRREAAFERLVEIARRSPAAREALDGWAAGSDELAWTARMARRELGRDASFGWLGGAPSSPARRGGGLYGGPELEEQLRGIEALLNDLRAGAWTTPGFPSALAAPGTVHEERQSYSIEVGPDGARVKVQEQVDGDQETREYEGGTLDEILRANPELEDKIRLRALDFDGETLLGELFEGDMARVWQDVDRRIAPVEPPTDILGIEFEAPSPEQVDRLDLEPGAGLAVLRTVPGTIAHILGLKRGDVVVELNQIPVYQGNDVSRVLKERLPDAPVAVAIVDSRGKRRTLTWKPSAAQAPAPSPEQSSAPQTPAPPR